jgi:DNA repair protein RecN (Recombination protein N)
MLTTLRIRNLVTIEDLSVSFGPGLNVLTGETGAGKSILVDALDLAAGGRADSSLVRSGAERAVVEAAFRFDDDPRLARLLDERGVDAAGGEIVVRREIASSSAGRVLVNGSPVTVGVLREIGALLVDLHGQNEHQGLLDPEHHLDLLDAFGGHAEAAARVAAAHAEVVSCEERRARLAALARDGERRSGELRAIAGEIREVDPQDGEADRLRRDRAVLLNASRVAEILEEAIGRLDDGQEPAIAAVSMVERRVGELARIDPSMAPLLDRLTSARLELQDARDTLRGYRDGIDFDPSRLESIEARRAALERLLLKWGPSEGDAVRAAEEAERELGTLLDLDGETAAAGRALEQVRAVYAEAARLLGAARREAAERLGPAVAAELAPLALGKAVFSVALPEARGPRIEIGGEPVTLSPRGAERAEFLLAANPGEPARPLVRAASGGELSRVMLALHVVLDRDAGRRSLVFDEVDAGVSGAVAVAVGARLARLAALRQVLCVTHLPQVAAHADGHYHVSKRVSSGRTHTAITPLEGEERIEDLARMLGGRQAGSAARNNAAELLVEAGRAGKGRGRR